MVAAQQPVAGDALHERMLERVARAGRANGGHDYRVVGEIRGGKSPVLLVASEEGARYAIKIVRMTEGRLPTCPVAFPPEAVRIFPVVDVFAWDDGYGLVMPVAEMSLREWLQRDEESSHFEALLAVLRDIVRALASIEGKMVHGDLKPENVLRHHGQWCLSDFGPSACPSSLIERGEYSLTPAYAAPEQWRGRPVTDRTDIYAFGVVAFELLNGIRPFLGPTPPAYRQQHLFVPAPSLIGMPSALAALVARCLRKRPRDRPSASEVLAFLETSMTDWGSCPVPANGTADYEDTPTSALLE